SRSRCARARDDPGDLGRPTRARSRREDRGLPLRVLRVRIRKPTRTPRETAGAAHSMHRGPHVEEGRVRARPSLAIRYGVQGLLPNTCRKLLIRVTVAPKPPKRG